MFLCLIGFFLNMTILNFCESYRTIINIFLQIWIFSSYYFNYYCAHGTFITVIINKVHLHG